MEASSEDPMSRVDSVGVQKGGPASPSVSSGNAPVTAGEASQGEGNRAPVEGEKECATLRELCDDSEPYDPASDLYYDIRLVGTRYHGKVPVGYAFVMVHHKATKIYELIGDISAPGKSDVVKCGGLCCAKSEPQCRTVRGGDAAVGIDRGESSSSAIQ